MAYTVPDSTTFTFQDVVDVVGGDDLVDAFALATDEYFDAAYKGDKDNLLNFRNYDCTPASSWYYSDTMNMTLPSPWVQNGAAGMIWSTGVFNIGSIARPTDCNVKIKVSLYNLEDVLITSGYIVGSDSVYFAYTAGGDDITGTVDVGNNLETGYKVVIDFYYST